VHSNDARHTEPHPCQDLSAHELVPSAHSGLGSSYPFDLSAQPVEKAGSVHPARETFSQSAQPVEKAGSVHPATVTDPDVTLSSPHASISPVSMDPDTLNKGRNLQDVLRMFKNSTTSPLSACVLETPKHKGKVAGSCEDHTPVTTAENPMQRKSPRFKEKNSQGKSILKLAQDLIAKKWGILGEAESLEQMTLQQYIDMYKEPLPENSMEAILKLTEVAEEKEKKKSKSKMSKTKKKEAAEKAEVNKMPDKKTKKGKKLKMAPEGAMA
jgi:hypothetical protein